MIYNMEIYPVPALRHPRMWSDRLPGREAGSGKRRSLLTSAALFPEIDVEGQKCLWLSADVYWRDMAYVRVL
jgi:hypothetical protein